MGAMPVSVALSAALAGLAIAQDSIPPGDGGEEFGGTKEDAPILGTMGSDCIRSRGGNDTTDALAGSDTIDGGRGQDTIDGGEGNDDIIGNKGRDIITDTDGETWTGSRAAGPTTPST